MKTNIAQEVLKGLREDDNTLDGDLTGGPNTYQVQNYPVVKFLEVSEDPSGGRDWQVLENAGNNAWTEDKTNGQITFTNARTGSVRVKYIYRATGLTNAQFRTLVRKKIRLIGQEILRKTARLRWKGRVELKGTLAYNRGNQIEIDAPGIFGSYNPQIFRIKSVEQRITSRGWSTFLTIEEEVTA